MLLTRTKLSLLLFSQLLLSWLSTYLISKISLIGRMGIAVFYREYRLLRSGWKTFLLLFGIQLILIILLRIIQKKYSKKILLLIASVLLLLGMLGLFLAFSDFMHVYSHRLMKERFHLGFYLFWLQWMGTCIFFLIVNKKIEVNITPIKYRSGF